MYRMKLHSQVNCKGWVGNERMVMVHTVSVASSHELPDHVKCVSTKKEGEVAGKYPHQHYGNSEPALCF